MNVLINHSECTYVLVSASLSRTAL